MKKFFYINFGAINSWGIDRMTQKLFFIFSGFVQIYIEHTKKRYVQKCRVTL